jgi:hypothetical protein
MRTIGVAVVSFVAGLLGSADAGDFRPLGIEAAPIFPLPGDLPSLVDVAPVFQAEPFALDPHPIKFLLNYSRPDFASSAISYFPAGNKVALRLEYHADPYAYPTPIPIPFEAQSPREDFHSAPSFQKEDIQIDVFADKQPFALEANPPPPHDVALVSIASGETAQVQLDRWALPRPSFIAEYESAVTQYLNSGGRPGGNIVSRAKAKVVPAPVVRSIEVHYNPGAIEHKDKILAKMRTRVGQRYSERLVEDDIRELTQMEDVKRVRIFGEPFDDGVKLFVIVQSKSGFDFNIGYQF